MKNCKWCNGPNGLVWSQEIGGKKHVSTELFCSLRCKSEFENKFAITWKKKGCFIATAVYSDYDHPVVLDLRLFRDNYLYKRKWGKNFISSYYTYSPRWASRIEKSRLLRFLAFILIVKPLHILVKLFRIVK